MTNLSLSIVCYDGDPTKCYTFVHRDRALASVVNSIITYIDPTNNCNTDDLVVGCTEKLQSAYNSPFVQMGVGDLQISIHCVELDNNLSSLLVDMFNVLKKRDIEPDLQEKICDIFSRSRL